MEPIRSILLAEEDAATRAFLTDNLTADGYRMLVADDKPAALELLEAWRPDLVVCDVNGDTLGLLDAVRQSDGLASQIAPDTPLIVLTAQADALARVRYFERGGDDVVTKALSSDPLSLLFGPIPIQDTPIDIGIRGPAIVVEPIESPVPPPLGAPVPESEGAHR